LLKTFLYLKHSTNKGIKNSAEKNTSQVPGRVLHFIKRNLELLKAYKKLMKHIKKPCKKNKECEGVKLSQEK
jgi:hypothetical protein